MSDVGLVAAHIKRPLKDGYLLKIRSKIYHTVLRLDATFANSAEPVEFSDKSALTFTPIKPGTRWGKGRFDCAWFYFSGKLPSCDKANLVAIIDVGGEGCLYDNDGNVVQGLTNVLGVTDVFQSTSGKKIIRADKLGIAEDGSIGLWVDAGYNGLFGKEGFPPRYKGAVIAQCRWDLLEYYYDYMSVNVLANSTEDKALKAEALRVLAVSRRTARGFSVESVAKARDCFTGIMSGKQSDFTVTAVGHAHLDLAWEWPVRETKRKAERTYSNALVNMELHPSYVYGSSQPQQFEWIKRNRPQLYSRIKEAVAQGRLEPQGGMWVEPDTNVSGGEALIRQCYYGKQFFREEFGVNVKTVWLPDVFGYSGALPQIIKKSDMDSFMTIKLSWNNINKFPYHSFEWAGIDNSKILVHMPPEGTYNSSASPYAFLDIEKQYRERAVSDIALMPYGIGDGGGGPGEYHVYMTERCAKLRGLPNVELATSESFFDKLALRREALPKYKGELYLEKHQGTYTTQSNVKKNNRETEKLLHVVEWLCTLLALRGERYPHERLDELWKETLLYQFHDILPGSSVSRVYADCDQRYPIIQGELIALRDGAIKALSIGDGLSVVNAAPVGAKGVLKLEGEWYAYDCAPYSSCNAVAAPAATQLACTESSIENALLRVEFNARGEVTAIIDKADGRNYVKTVCCALRIYHDKKLFFNAWDIDINYTKRRPACLAAKTMRPFTDGQRVGMACEYVYGKSRFTQRVFLETDGDTVQCEVDADWHETHKMLRAECYPSVYSDVVKCDIQFGHIDRSTGTQSSVDYARFEICAHKWVDVSDEKCGFAMLSDGKYGFRAKDGIVSMNLLRSPIFPDPTADRGKHSFRYAIYVHKGTAMQSALVQRGYNLSYPVLAAKGASIAPAFDFQADGVLMETVLITPQGGVAVRAYEWRGTGGEATIIPRFDYSAAEETDMLFENGKPVGEKLSFSPFEIKTIVFRR